MASTSFTSPAGGSQRSSCHRNHTQCLPRSVVARIQQRWFSIAVRWSMLLAAALAVAREGMHRNAAGQLVFDVPDHVTRTELATAIAARLAGAAEPARSTVATLASVHAPPASRVVWVDHGDEVLLHLDAVQVQVVGNVLLVAVDLECDQSGRQPLVVPLALPGADEAPSMVCVADELPRGNATLATRWGAILTDAVWSALVDLAQRHAQERGTQPRGFTLTRDGLQLAAGAAAEGSR